MTVEALTAIMSNTIRVQQCEQHKAYARNPLRWTISNVYDLTLTVQKNSPEWLLIQWYGNNPGT